MEYYNNVENEEKNMKKEKKEKIKITLIVSDLKVKKLLKMLKGYCELAGKDFTDELIEILKDALSKRIKNMRL